MDKIERAFGPGEDNFSSSMLSSLPTYSEMNTELSGCSLVTI